MSVKTLTVTKFIGLNQAPSGSTDLHLGEASVAENFFITDDCKLKTRPGTYALAHSDAALVGFWQGLIGRRLWLVTIWSHRGSNYCSAEFSTVDDPDNQISYGTPFFVDANRPIKIFSFGDKIYVCGTSTDSDFPIAIMSIASDGRIARPNTQEVGYAPLVVTGALPAGGGETLEPVNLLSNRVRIRFSADGAATRYVLPSMVSEILSVTVDEQELDAFSYEQDSHTAILDSAPTTGVNNVEFLCEIRDNNLQQGRDKFLSMRHCEAYNGSTDSRIFFYGDGTNICYYTGVPAYGEGLYLPSMFEIAVDSSASAITGMRRHYTRLMVYKADGTFSINYEPITLADGSVTAGFYVHPASRDVGNDMDNQIQTVGNYPRTLCGGAMFEWRHTASYYQDERYAKRIGQQVALLLQSADPQKIVTCDDDSGRTYYMFLNDDAGTVIVNRYELDAWTVYTGQVFKGIRYADGFHGNLLFANENTVFTFDANSAFDISVTGVPIPIACRWESGYLSFGADHLRKYSSTLWVSMLPEAGSNMEITVQTDRRDEYMVKSAGRPLLDFNALDFSNFSFLVSRAPKIQRIKLKVKKFVYYKLIFTVSTPGARATVLGYDQQIRYASQVK